MIKKQEEKDDEQLQNDEQHGTIDDNIDNNKDGARTEKETKRRKLGKQSHSGTLNIRKLCKIFILLSFYLIRYTNSYAKKNKKVSLKNR